MFYYKYCFIIGLIVFLSGCSRLDAWDKKIGEIFYSDDGSFVQEEKSLESKQIEFDSKHLSKKQKETIDVWLQKNNLNRYGDSLNSYYSGGTPLFDENSGETKERYEYILENHPEALAEL